MSRLAEWRQQWATPRLFRMTLFCLPFIDELVSGIPVLTLPLARAELHFSYTQVGLLFTIAELTGLLINPMLNAASDYWPKPRLVLGGMVGLALGFALAGSSPSWEWLLVAFILMGATNSAAVSIGGAILIDQAPAATLSTTTRWGFLSTIGDLVGPLVVAATLALQGSWRLLMGMGALIWFTFALFLGVQRPTKAQSTIAPGEQEPPFWQTLRANLAAGLQAPDLLRWLLLATIPSLLDELFLGFAGLLLTDRLHVAASTVSLFLLAPVGGGLLSLGWLARWGKQILPTKVLGYAALITISGLLCFIMAANAWLALFGLLLTGIGAAPWFPIAQAQAFAALPGRTGTVGALHALFAPIEIGAPLLIGLIAEEWGIQIGVSSLLIAPLLILFLRPRQQSKESRDGR
ncbi:MAG: MFS transporter [Caldilineaceae bacterium]|nr:MFS transporter [Caldilineaceae bacterium]